MCISHAVLVLKELMMLFDFFFDRFAFRVIAINCKFIVTRNVAMWFVCY